MKNFTLLFVLLLPIFGFSQALSGNKTIGGIGADYSTLAIAVTDINQKGISGPVTFLLNENQNVTSPITINQLSGTSATNTLTIKPNVGKNITISGNNQNSYTVLSSVIQLKGAKNVIIDGSNTVNGISQNLTFLNNNTVDYNDTSVLWISNANNVSVNSIIVKNTTLQFSNRNQHGKFQIGIFIGGDNSLNSIPETTLANVDLTNNKFINVREGIQILSGANNSQKISDINVNNNSFGSTSDSNKPQTGISAKNVNSISIINNDFSGFANLDSSTNKLLNGINISGTIDFTIQNNNLEAFKINHTGDATNSAINIDGASSNGLVEKNKINNIEKTSGATISGITLASSATASNIKIYNNFISNIRANGNNNSTTGGSGLRIVSGNGYKIYHNTINLSVMGNNYSNQMLTSAVYIINGTSLDIKNNIFVNTQIGGSIYAIYSVNNATFSTLNYNNYFASIQGNISLGANSKNVNPTFITSSNLKLQEISTNEALKSGTPISEVTTDIEEDIRSTTSPTMGADELAGRCGSSTTWNGANWSNGNPNDTKKAVIAGNYSGISFSACELQINSNVTVNVGTDTYIQVVSGIVNNGTLVLENTASLIQIENDATYTGNAITVKKITTPMKRYDFTYWSSPVIGYTLQALSPDTLGDKYYSYNPITGWTIHYNGTATMTPGTGYIVRAPQSYSITDPQVFSTKFVGIPNTGNITQPIVANASNLIGNPYPSAISADAIFNANSSVIDGTFYFWTHNSLPSTANSGNATYNYSSDDYASYNGVGGVKTKSAATGGQTPTGNIASGQSFFVTGKSNGTVTYANAMRVKAGNNSQFFKNSNANQSEPEPATIEKNRLWLNISNESGDFNETLVGYVTNATNGLDKAFDGANLSAGTTTLYSIIDNNNLVIQGRALPFTNTDVVPLGIKISTAGQYTINMDQFDGLFTNQNIYLFDSLTNTTHDLKASDYVFNSEIGTFNSRFEIRYVNGTELGIDTPIVTNNDIVVYRSGNQIAVKATNFTIDSVQVYDITGKLINSAKNVNDNTFTTSGLNVSTQVVIVKVNLDNNQSVSKKVIMN